MSGNGFGTAIYTNCAPGEGLDGVAGMQFQSRSPGVDGDALALIRRNLLYEPPERLIHERQPVGAFPPSFAHVYDGVFATAAGVYVGREAAGTREGNHLTHAIVTDDARAYRSVRPVQMFHAPFWQAEPAASKQSERLGTSWQPGPLNAGQAGQFVRDQPDGPAMLGAILTAVLAHLRRAKRIEPPRVLFIADRPEPVLLWLTAATLLIPQREAVHLGFKVFTADPARSALPVVAVHPEWVTSTPTVKDDRGYVVFDLVEHRWTEFAASGEAEYWAQWFCQADPYEVSEAVELAAASGVAGKGGRDLATVAVLHQAPVPGSVDTIVRWLKTGPPALRESYGGTLTEALAQLPDLLLLRQVDTEADEHFPSRRDQVRLALLRLELDNAIRNPIMYQPERPRRPVSAAIGPEAARLVAEAIRQAPRPAFDAVLRVSNRFDVPVPPDAVREATTAFINHWADNPDAGYEPSAWPSALPVNAMLRSELSARMVKEPTLADRWCRRLPDWAPDRADLTVPLERALLAAAMATGSPQERLRIVRNTLRLPGTEASPVGYRELADLLWARTRPSTDELRELCHMVPIDEILNQALFADLVASAHANPTRLPELELCGSLAEKGLLRLDLTAKQMLADHRWLLHFERQLTSPLPTPGSDTHLAEISEGLINAHARPLARGLRAIWDPPRVRYLLHSMPTPVVAAYLSEILAAGRRPLDPGEVALAFDACALLAVRDDGSHPPRDGGSSRLVRDAVYGVVSAWCLAEPRRSIRRVTRQLASFDSELAARWEHWAAEMRQPWWRGIITWQPGR